VARETGGCIPAYPPPYFTLFIGCSFRQALVTVSDSTSPTSKGAHFYDAWSTHSRRLRMSGFLTLKSLLPVSRLSFVVRDRHDAHDVRLIQINNRERESV
jgi:hypothetical protein